MSGRFGEHYATGRPTAKGRVCRRARSLLWIEEPERKLVWARAARVSWKQISAEHACDRSTAWRRWQIALTKIAARLNAD